MKIYFAGSIRGGRQDRELYLQIIEILSQYGEVLTEHVGNEQLSSYGETHMTDQEICERDLAWIMESDVVVAEVTTPSLGVGYEIGFAQGNKKPVLALYREQDGKRASAMICGNTYLTFKKYSELTELKPIFDQFLKHNGN